MAFWCECVSVRARVFSSDLWACVRHTGPPKEPVGRRFRLKPPERTSGVCGAEAGGNEPRLRGPSPPRGGLNDFYCLQIPSFLFGFCKLRKVVSFFLWQHRLLWRVVVRLGVPVWRQAIPGQTHASVITHTATARQTDPGESTDSHHACAPERYF